MACRPSQMLRETGVSEEFIHLSVLGTEAPEALVTNPDGIYVDGTFGRGGHSRRILAKLSEKGRLIAFDRDPAAVATARTWTDPRFTIIHEPFSTMLESLAEIGVEAVDGIFLDIGVSSPQIDDASRGFSFRFDGPLDMRMDTTRGVTAEEWLATAEERDIRHVISLYGEERFAGPIARAIIAARKNGGIHTTRELADLVASVVPRNKKDMGQHPATRTFQAVRIEVNHELDELKAALDAAGRLLKPEGRLAVISFHSLEDRIVKHFFDRTAHPERGLDPRLPLTQDMLPAPLFERIERIKPGKLECEKNPRARSAILRVGTRTSASWRPEDGACAR